MKLRLRLEGYYQIQLCKDSFLKYNLTKNARALKSQRRPPKRVALPWTTILITLMSRKIFTLMRRIKFYQKVLMILQLFLDNHL